jgi:hypothetical protein
MDERRERRNLERLQIEGAKISLRRERSVNLLERYSEPFPVKDMTWSSVRFLTDRLLQTGEVVELEIIVPGERKIHVRGHLVWTSAQANGEEHYAVVQFLPFGNEKPYNPMKYKEILKRLIDRHKKVRH